MSCPFRELVVGVVGVVVMVLARIAVRAMVVARGPGGELLGEGGDDQAYQVDDRGDLIVGQAVAVCRAVVGNPNVDVQWLAVDGDLVGGRDDDVVTVEVVLADTAGRVAMYVFRPGKASKIVGEKGGMSDVCRVRWHVVPPNSRRCGEVVRR
jgi:hypothetical protein